MTHPLRSEDKDAISFITNRTIGSRLWFINNKSLEDSILSYLAKYQKIYQVKLYALILMGNHYHLIAQFPNCNKSAFMQSFNSIIAKLVPEHVASFISESSNLKFGNILNKSLFFYTGVFDTRLARFSLKFTKQ